MRRMPLGRLPPELVVLGGIAKKIDHLLNFRLGFFDAGDVFKTNGGALPDPVHAFAAARTGLVEQEKKNETGDHQGRR